MKPPVCVAEGLTRRYGATEALADCSFRLEGGEVLGLAGPNGAGKSTLARMLTGFVQPTSGSLRIEGMAPSVFRARHGVGYLPEDVTFYPDCTPFELMSLRGSTGTLDARRATTLLGLEPLLYRPLRTLSKGQARQVFTAYAALGPSRLVVLDEPDSGLDPTALDRLRDLVLSCSEAGAIVVILSHQLPELAEVCTRVLFLRSGRITGAFGREEVVARGARNLYRELCA